MKLQILQGIQLFTKLLLATWSKAFDDGDLVERD